MSVNHDRVTQMNHIRRLIDVSADRIVMELAARASGGVSLTCDATLNLVKRELAGFGVAIGLSDKKINNANLPGKYEDQDSEP